MRVALITDGIWPYVLGGMQKHSYYLCKYLARQQVHIDVFHFNESVYDISKLEFFTETEKKFIVSHCIDFPKSKRFPGHYLYNSYRYSKLVFESLKSKLADYDFIYTKGFTGWYLINQKRKHNLNCAPVAVKFHGYEMFQKAPGLKILFQYIFILRWPVRFLSQQADFVFSYGGKITELIKSIGVDHLKIIELPSGVEETSLVKQVRPASEVIKFLFLGRYERRKGIEELNRAIALFFDSNAYNKRAEFHFIGPIPEEKFLDHSQVIYHGEIRDKERLQALIRQFDILVCPSWSEGMPNVILEAMANGLAVIATDTGATNVLVNEKTGWLLSNSEPSKIKMTLDEVMHSDVSRITAKKEAALDLISRHYTWENLVIKLKDQFLKTTIQ